MKTITVSVEEMGKELGAAQVFALRAVAERLPLLFDGQNDDFVKGVSAAMSVLQSAALKIEKATSP